MGWVEWPQTGAQGAPALAMDFVLGEKPHTTCVPVLMPLGRGVMLTLAWYVRSSGICSGMWCALQTPVDGNHAPRPPGTSYLTSVSDCHDRPFIPKDGGGLVQPLALRWGLVSAEQCGPSCLGGGRGAEGQRERSPCRFLFLFLASQNTAHALLLDICTPWVWGQVWSPCQ